jgi:hypothetical protein
MHKRSISSHLASIAVSLFLAATAGSAFASQSEVGASSLTSKLSQLVEVTKEAATGSIQSIVSLVNIKSGNMVLVCSGNGYKPITSGICVCKSGYTGAICQYSPKLAPPDRNPFTPRDDQVDP